MNTNGLRKLWKEAFGDTDLFLDAFFSTGFHPDRFQALWEQEEPVAALYWFDCHYRGRKIAYIYAVATARSHRGRGLCRQLMDKTHKALASRGYSGSILAPAEDNLFDMYAKLGYTLCAKITGFSCTAGVPIPLTPLTADAYAHLRRESLPEEGLIQEGVLLTYLGSWCQFYQGENCLVCASRIGEELYVQELLGDRKLAPGITAALGANVGHFRTPGEKSPFAMYYALDNSPAPGYLGLALD